MVLFHFIFNLNAFFGIDIPYHKGFWFFEGRVAAIIFIVLVGVVSSLISKRENRDTALRINSRRGQRLIALGFLITLATFFLARENMIWFGILHFLGLSILITMALCEYKWLNIMLAIILFAGYFSIRNLYTKNYFGLIFGVIPDSFTSYDHYALIPWLGFVLIGITLGNWIYSSGQPLIRREPNKAEKALISAGKHSLWIYLLHQPILLAFMWLFFRFLQ